MIRQAIPVSNTPTTRRTVIYFCDEVSVHIWVQLFQQIARVFRPISTQMLFLEEEVHAEVCLADDRRVLYREIADAWKYEVLECLETDDTGSGVDQEHVRIFERDLPISSPQTELAVVPASVSCWELLNLGCTYFFSFADGP